MSNAEDALELCQQSLGYRFKDTELLKRALTHASVADNRLQSNERLEFLGDSILGLVVCRELYDRFPGYLEGELTKVKSMIVSRRTCARLADEMGLCQFLKVGKGMLTHERIPISCRAAVLESVLGAVYLDGGEKAAWALVLRLVEPLLDEADAQQHQENFKSMLQQHAQGAGDSTPAYEVLDEKGPDHSKCFEVAVVIGRRRFPSAWGPSKKEAEQLAAYCALQELKVLGPESKFPSPSVRGSTP